MNWPKLGRNMKWLLVACGLIFSSACCKARIEPRYINVMPKLEPLPAETLQAMQPDSTELLKKAEDWYESSGELLDSVTDN